MVSIGLSMPPVSFQPVGPENGEALSKSIPATHGDLTKISESLGLVERHLHGANVKLAWILGIFVAVLSC